MVKLTSWPKYVEYLLVVWRFFSGNILIIRRKSRFLFSIPREKATETSTPEYRAKDHIHKCHSGHDVNSRMAVVACRGVHEVGPNLSSHQVNSDGGGEHHEDESQNGQCVNQIRPHSSVASRNCPKIEGVENNSVDKESPESSQKYGDLW